MYEVVLNVAVRTLRHGRNSLTMVDGRAFNFPKFPQDEVLKLVITRCVVGGTKACGVLVLSGEISDGVPATCGDLRQFGTTLSFPRTKVPGQPPGSPKRWFSLRKVGVVCHDCIIKG